MTQLITQSINSQNSNVPAQGYAGLDTIFQYRGRNGLAAHCRLRCYPLMSQWEDTCGKNAVVVVLTEMEDNPGTSITNALEVVAPAVVSAFKLEPGRVVWIEHYPQRPPSNDPFDDDTGAEEFALVTFRLVQIIPDSEGQYLYAQPVWTFLPREKIDLLTGRAWQPERWKGATK